MCEKEESLFEQERQDFLWYALFGILKSDVDESAPRSDTNKSANRKAALQKCIELAYRDFNRTLEFTYSNDTLDKMKKNGGKEGEKAEEYETCKDSWKAKCKKLLQGEIEELIGRQSVEQPDFDSWHKELCEKLAGRLQSDKLKVYNRSLFEETEEEEKGEKKGLTFGHAQKWVNMTLKYMLIMNIDEWKMDRLVRYLHVPIDNYILQYVRDEEAEKGNKGPCVLSLDPSSKVYIYAENKIEIDLGKKSYPRDPWSKISDYDGYKAIQNQLKQFAEKDMEQFAEKDNKWPIVWENYAWLELAKRQQKRNEDNSES